MDAVVRNYGEDPGGGGERGAPDGFAYRPAATQEPLGLLQCRDLHPLPGWAEQRMGERAWRLLEVLLPCVQWLAVYEKGMLQTDVLAGATVGVMVIPQSMAYAVIAGLPPVVGLYCAFVPIFIYALYGSSRQLAIGPVALMSLLTSSGLSKFADPEAEPARYLQLAATLAFLAGVFQVLLGGLRMGFIINLLSHAIISGFTSAAAVLIGLSQLKHILGYSIPHTETLIHTVEGVVHGAPNFHWPSCVMGLSLLGTLLGMRHAARKYKRLAFLKPAAPVIISVVAAVLVYALDLERHGIKIVGTVLRGLPAASANFVWEDVGGMVTTALMVSFVGFVESISIARALAAKNDYELDVNKELFGVGLANLVGSFFSIYPVTGSFSRSAVNNDTGAKSGLAGAVTGVMVLFTLLFLTPLVYFLPMTVLAAIVMTSVASLVDTREFKFLRLVHKKDLLPWIMAFVGTLLLGVELGIALSVCVSHAFVIHETARPHTAILGQLPGTKVFCSVTQYVQAQTVPGITVLRIDAPLYFANVAFVKDRMREVEHSKGQGVRVRFVIMEMGPITSVDSTGVHTVMDMISEYEEKGVKLCLSNPNGDVMRTFERAGIVDRIGKEWIFFRVHEAVAECKRHMAELGELGGVEQGGLERGGIAGSGGIEVLNYGSTTGRCAPSPQLIANPPTAGRRSSKKI